MCHGMHIAKTGRIERHASQELRVPQCMFTHHNLGQQAWKKVKTWETHSLRIKKNRDLSNEEWQKINLKPT